MGFNQDELQDPNNPNPPPPSMAQRMAMGLGSLLGSNAAGAPAPGVAPAAVDTPPMPPASSPRPTAQSPLPPTTTPPQKQGGFNLSDNFKMGLVPLITALAGGMLGGNKGAMMGAGTGLQATGKELDAQRQREILQAQKDVQDKRDINKAVAIDNAKEQNREKLAQDKQDIKPDKPAKMGEYTSADGKRMFYGPLNDDGTPVDPTKGADRGPAKVDPLDLLDERDKRAAKKERDTVYKDLTNNSSKPRGRTDVQQALVGNANIKKVLDIYDNAPGGDLNNITSQQAAIANQEIAKIAAGGVGSEHGVQSQAANTLVQKWQDWKSHLTGEPTPADIGNFLKINQKYVEDMYKTNTETIHNYHRELYGNVAHKLDPADDAAFTKTHPWVNEDYIETPSGMVRMKDEKGVEHFVPRLNAGRAKSEFKWKKVAE